MKKFLLLFLLLSGFANAQVLDQSSLSANASFQTIDSGIVVSQSFTAGLNGQLSSISFDMEMLNCNTGMNNFLFGCWVYDSTGTNAIANQSGFIPVPYSRALYNIGFVNPAVLVAGNQYVIKIFANPQLCDTLTQSNATLRWFHAGEDSTYSAGTASIDGSPMLYDFHFQTYVTAGCASPITANPFVVSGATCGNNDAELSVNPTGGFGPYSYSWSPSGGNSQSTGTTLAPGMYTVTVSDTTGCVSQGSVFAYASNPIYATPNIGANISCTAPGSLYANPSGGNGGYTYLWSNAATTQTIGGLTSPGYYTVTVTDNLGCTTTDSIYLPDMSMSVTINAYNATCGLNNGYIFATPSYANGPTFSWSGPLGYTSSNQNINGLTPGTYSLIVTDTVCPSFYDTIIISGSAPFSISHTINNNITCNGAHDGSATIVINGGLGGFVSWGNGETGMTAYNLPPGFTTIFLNDSIQCQGYDTVYISEPPILMDSLSFTEPSCGASNGTVSTNVSGGTAPYSYFWSTGNMASTISGVDAGIYMVDITDANGCFISDIAVLGSAGGPTISQDVHTDITCHGANNGSIEVSISGGIAPYTVYWTDMDSSYTTLIRNNLQAGPYELVVADASGCQTIFSTYVYEPSPISIDMFTSSPTACANPDGSITTNVNGGTAPYVYLWSDASTGSSLTGLMAGVYSLTVTDANGCSAVNEAFLSDPTMLIAYGYDIPTNCGTNTGSIDITTYNGWGNYSYQWTNGATTEDISGLYPGNYGVTITDLFDGCVKALEFTVNSSTANYAPEVCLVTVDTLDEKNVIVWERPAIGGIREFVIYRETSTPGIYRYIGTNPIDSLTEMKDTLANTDLHTWKYKISAIDSCGVETGVSEIEHRPIYLTVDTNNIGLPSLVWTSYMGRPYSDYVVKRNVNGTGWVDVVTLPASQNSFVDVNCPSGSIEYTIEALFTTTCNSTRGAINTTRSNIKSPSSVIVGLKGNTATANNVSLFPNPSQDNFTVSLANKVKENVNIEVVNALGQVVYTTTINESSKTTTIAAANWNTGVYFVRINSSEMHSVIKFVKQ